MNTLSKEEKQEILDSLGRIIIKKARDRVLLSSMDILTLKTVNLKKKEYYHNFAGLTKDQQEAMCDLLSETISDVIYSILEMFEERERMMKFTIIKDGKEYDMLEISEKMGSEIACYEENEGWIQRFSEVGRFVL